VQLFLFRDRKDTGYLLSPTHEEEITSLVANTVKSYKELPARLYQICMTRALNVNRITSNPPSS
jgi:prolyl-tRNA synthetase